MQNTDVINNQTNDYVGKFFVGKVVQNNPADKKFFGQIRVRLPIWDEIADDNDLPFCLLTQDVLRGNIITPEGSYHVGSFKIPNNGSKVVVIFDAGVETSGIVIKEIMDGGNVLNDPFTDPKVYGWRDENNNEFYVDKDSSINVKHKSGSSIVVDKDGNVKVTSVEKIEAVSKTGATITDDVSITATVGENSIKLNTTECEVKVGATTSMLLNAAGLTATGTLITLNGNTTVNGTLTVTEAIIGLTVAQTTPPVSLGTHTHPFIAAAGDAHLTTSAPNP